MCARLEAGPLAPEPFCAPYNVSFSFPLSFNRTLSNFSSDLITMYRSRIVNIARKGVAGNVTATSVPKVSTVLMLMRRGTEENSARFDAYLSPFSRHLLRVDSPVPNRHHSSNRPRARTMLCFLLVCLPLEEPVIIITLRSLEPQRQMSNKRLGNLNMQLECRRIRKSNRGKRKLTN